MSDGKTGKFDAVKAREYRTQAEYLEGLRQAVNFEKQLGRLRERLARRADGGMAPRPSDASLEIAAARRDLARREHEDRVAATRAAGIVLPIDRLAEEYALDERERQFIETVLVEMTDLNDTRTSRLELARIAGLLGGGDPGSTQAVLGLVLPDSNLLQKKLLMVRGFGPVLGDWQVAVAPTVYERLFAGERVRAGEKDGTAPGMPRPAVPDVRAHFAERGVVLEEDAMTVVERVFAEANSGEDVLVSWGFPREFAGRGVVALFHGPSGTGKTLTARTLAEALGRDLHVVSYAEVFNAYVGQTEKAIVRMFAEAKEKNAVLLLDEADALLGRRGEISRAVDRHFNSEVNTVLMELEKHEGVVILTSNLPGLLDPALARRIGHKVVFAAPCAEVRARIWRAKFPAAAPLAPDVDFAALGEEYELTGGQIANAVRNAVFVAKARCRRDGSAEIRIADIRAAAEAEERGYEAHTGPEGGFGFAGGGR